MKSQIPSTKLQINSKFQYPMTKIYLELSYFKMMQMFGILNFGHCDLFVIWVLLFVIFNRFSFYVSFS